MDARVDVLPSGQRLHSQHRHPAPAAAVGPTSAFAGRAAWCRRRAAITSSRPTPTAASSSGSTASSSATTGGRNGCRGTTWRGSIWKPAGATRCGSTGPPPAIRRSCNCAGKRPAADSATSLWSEVGGGTDYYFVYGPDLDRVVAGYRELTGRAPMMPRWAFGLWQSRQRYRTAQELLDVRQGLPRPRHPLRQHRPGLVLLAARRLGFARVRPGAFSGSRGPDPYAPRPVPRATDDLRLAEVLSRHQEFRRHAGAPLPLPAQPAGEDPRLGRVSPTRSTMRSIPTRGSSSGRRSSASCSASTSTPGGWTPPSLISRATRRSTPSAAT